MMEIGARELRANLSAILDAAEAGTPVVIARRGKKRLRLVVEDDHETPIQRGIREGWVSVGPGYYDKRPRPRPNAYPSKPGVRLEDVIAQDRS